MSKKVYRVQLTGTDPMLWHRDNLEFDPKVKDWQKINKDTPKGDDRHPAWKYIGSFYHNNKILGLDSMTLAANLSEAAKGITMQGKKTYKEPAQTAVEYDSTFVAVKINGREVPVKSFAKLMDDNEQDIQKHIDNAESLGLSLDIRRVKVGQAKHVRVRPRLPEGWTAEFKITVDDDIISKETLEQIYHLAGTKKGLGDWRPGAPKPGTFGRFSTTLTSTR